MKTLKEWVDEARTIAVITGAGMSTESGIPDFRSQNGIWVQDAELMRSMSKSFLEGHPKDFWRKRSKLNHVYDAISLAAPNRGHEALAMLQETKDISIFTQNIDGLHQKAGSRTVYEMHGNGHELVCPKCKTRYVRESFKAVEIPRCTRDRGYKGPCNFILHPDTVLFGQMVRHYKEAAKVIRDADLALVLGTSLTVYPVAELPMLARKLIIINQTETPFDNCADLVIREAIGETLAQLV